MSVLQDLLGQVERLNDLLRDNQPFQNERGQQNRQIKILTAALLDLLKQLEPEERKRGKEGYVELKSGPASIDLKPNGEVVIKGRDIILDATGRIVGKASGDVVLKGSKVQTS